MQIKTPAQIAEASLAAGTSKIQLTRRDKKRLFVQSIMAGAFIAFGGILSLIVGYGCPEITGGNPGIQKLLSGCMFPIGLILVVVLGAELFTGNNALLIPAYMRKNASVGDIALNWSMVYAGNFVGAVMFTFTLVVIPGLLVQSPYHEAILAIGTAKVSQPWLTIFMKGIGANWCVCLAVWLALSGKTLIEKCIGCWFPVMAFVALGYEHSIANMFYLPAAMAEGAAFSAWDGIWNNLIPATIGNIVGGALLVGCVHSYVHLRKQD